MNSTFCVIAQLQADTLFQSQVEHLKTQGISGMKVVHCDNAKTTTEALRSHPVGLLVIRAQDNTASLQQILKTFRDTSGGLSEYQLIVCPEPSPELMMAVFDYGADHFSAPMNWEADAFRLAQTLVSKAADECTPEYAILALGSAMRRGDVAQIQSMKEKLEEHIHYDFQAAFSHGNACAYTGDLDGALRSFQLTQSLNKQFRPSQEQTAETFMLLGNFAQAITLFKKLDAVNPRNLSRKANLATAHSFAGNTEESGKLLAQIPAEERNDPAILEATAHQLLQAGKISEAFALLDRLQSVGPLLAGRLNDLGVRLSKEGRGKEALILYDRAHRIVRLDLRYKVSMNAALACRRVGNLSAAMKYIQRSELEYGAPLEKITRIKEALEAETKVKGGAA